MAFGNPTKKSDLEWFWSILWPLCPFSFYNRFSNSQDFEWSDFASPLLGWELNTGRVSLSGIQMVEMCPAIGWLGTWMGSEYLTKNVWYWNANGHHLVFTTKILDWTILPKQIKCTFQLGTTFIIYYKSFWVKNLWNKAFLNWIDGIQKSPNHFNGTIHQPNSSGPFKIQTCLLFESLLNTDYLCTV